MKIAKSIFSTVALTIIVIASFGQTPKSVTIGKQVWMAENLDVLHVIDT